MRVPTTRRLFRRSAAALSLVATLAAASPSPAQQAPPPAPVRTAEYLIGPGDTLQVFVWRQPDLTVTVPVRPDGRISAPLVGDIVVVNKTPQQLAKEIEVALAEFVRSPEVNVIVQSSVGTFGTQIRVMGQAATPRAIPFREQMTLMDVIIEAGGLTQFAAGNRSHVIRNVDGRTERIRVRLEDLVKKGDTKRNIVMQPGDIVVIPEAVF